MGIGAVTGTVLVISFGDGDINNRSVAIPKLLNGMTKLRGNLDHDSQKN